MSTELNRALWDERAPVHAASPDYGVERFAQDPEHLSDTVRFDLPRLGDGEIVTALLEAGLQLTMLVEHDGVPWEAVPGQMVRAGLGEWRLREQPERLPLTCTLQAVKRA